MPPLWREAEVSNPTPLRAAPSVFKTALRPPEMTSHMVAGVGFEPTSAAHEAAKVPLLYPAICSHGMVGAIFTLSL